MENCVFCQIIAGKIPAQKVYDNDDFIAFLDIKPINPGHVLLVTKAHYKNLFDMPSDLLIKIGPHLLTLAQAIKAATAAPGLNIGWNNGSTAGQIVDHAHIHIIPRFAADGLRHWPGKDITPAELAETKEKIIHALAN